jgi:sterol desaturase/sphingolipid hydroxylase (fatty acid hydroxylase superfamily)
MGELLKEALQVLLQPLVILLHPRGPWSVYYWAGALVFLAIFFFAWYGRRYRRRGLRGFLAYAFPKHIFGHPSAKVDYRFFLANALVGPLIFSVAIAASEFWRGLTLDGLHALFGIGADAPGVVWPVVALTTVVIFLALEFGYWFAHVLLHHVPVLWEIHKVHHSAEVMTPATATRVHPLEDVLISNIIAVTVGIAYGLLVYAFGTGAQEFALWQVNVLFLVFYFTTYHLRHSHVWMTVPGSLARLIHSPAHHQIHHSTDPRHMNKNLGFSLSLWDWVFGTLWVPGKDEKVRFGIGAESRAFNSVWRLFWLPLANIGRMAWRGLRGQPLPEEAGSAARP